MFYIRRTEFILKDVTDAFRNKKMYQKYICLLSIVDLFLFVLLFIHTSTSRHLFHDLQSNFPLAFIVGWILTRTMRLFYLGLK